MTTAVLDASPKTITALLGQLSAEHAELLPHIDYLLQLATMRSPRLSDHIGKCEARLRTPIEEHIAQEDNLLFPVYTDRTGKTALSAFLKRNIAASLRYATSCSMPIKRVPICENCATSRRGLPICCLRT